MFFEEAEMATLVRLRPLAVRPPLYGIPHRRRHFRFLIAARRGVVVCVCGWDNEWCSRGVSRQPTRTGQKIRRSVGGQFCPTPPRPFHTETHRNGSTQPGNS